MGAIRKNVRPETQSPAFSKFDRASTRAGILGKAFLSCQQQLQPGARALQLDDAVGAHRAAPPRAREEAHQAPVTGFGERLDLEQPPRGGDPRPARRGLQEGPHRHLPGGARAAPLPHERHDRRPARGAAPGRHGPLRPRARTRLPPPRAARSRLDPHAEPGAGTRRGAALVALVHAGARAAPVGGRGQRQLVAGRHGALDRRPARAAAAGTSGSRASASLPSWVSKRGMMKCTGR